MTLSGVCKIVSLIIIVSKITKGIPSYEGYCGTQHEMSSNRIFGGEVIQKENNEFPWVVSFHLRAKETFFCAGSLISDRHVLSAAHCFQHKGEEEAITAFEILCKLGRYNLSDNNEKDSVNALIGEVFIHPDWKFDSHNYDADIAIAVLREVVEFTDNIKPVCLPEFSYGRVEGNGTVVGWGKSENSSRSSEQHDQVPSKVVIPAINGTHCYTTYPKLAAHSSNRIFCGGYESLETSPCMGDSGGGFYQQGQLSTSWNIRGIVSGSLASIKYGCDINKFSLYTHVARFVDWIQTVTKETNESSRRFIDFDCSLSYERDGTFCALSHDVQIRSNDKILPNFSQHNKIKDAKDVKKMKISFGKSAQMISGVGEVFPALKELDIDTSDRLNSLERKDFSNLTNLRELNMFSFPISLIAEDVFQEILHLERLKIVHCRIETIHKNLFKNMSKLVKLDFSFNNIKIITEMAFSDLSSLKILDLNSCQLEKLTTNSFKSLSKLKILNLNFNLIETIEANSFEDLLSLEVLKLFGCRIEFLNENTFTSLKKLVELDLSENPLRNLPANVFYNLRSLEYLNFENCKLEGIPANLLKNTQQLKKISLFNNRLEKIFEDFTRLTKIGDIDLRQNICIDAVFVKASPNFSTAATVVELQSIINKSCAIDEIAKDKI